MRPDWTTPPSDPRFAPRPTVAPGLLKSHVAQVAEEGFLADRVWFHGSARRISRFRQGTKDLELGPGTYLADEWKRARSWAQDAGFVMSCVVRDGDFMDLAALDRDDVVAELFARHGAVMAAKWGAEAADESLNEFKDRLRQIKRSRVSVNKLLAATGFVGAYDHRSQIIGQVVIFNPEDVQVVGAVKGDWTPAADRDDLDQNGPALAAHGPR